MPGTGTTKLSGINRSTKASTKAKEINRLFSVSFFNFTTIYSVCLNDKVEVGEFTVTLLPKQ